MGLRGELTKLRTELVQTANVNDRPPFFNLFPSIHLNYQLKEGNSVQASYSRRIQRPWFMDLNPFFSFHDDRSFGSGNPDLNPAYTNAYEIGYAVHWNQSSLHTGVYYRRTSDVVNFLTLVNEGGVSYTFPDNFGSEDAYGAEFAYAQSISNWWELNLDLNFFRSQIAGGEDSPEYRTDYYSWTGRITNRLTLAKKLLAQLRLNYAAPQKTLQGTAKAITYLDLTLRRKILKDRGQLTINLRDALNSRTWRETINTPNFRSVLETQLRVRTFSLGLNYHLDKDES